MIKTILKTLTLLSLFLMLTAQEGCQTTSSMSEKKVSPKQAVKQEMIAKIQTDIMSLGGTPLTEDEAKYKGALGKDKYIVALEKQLLEIKALKQEEKNAAKKKADEAEKEKNRAAAIQDVRKEILFLGETPMPEYEFTSEDKYIAALRKQIEEIKKIKSEEEFKINAEIPEWYQAMPQGSETVMYARGSATSADLDNSEQRAVENALIKLSTQMNNRINTKTNIAVKEAGIDADLTLKTEMKRITSIVVKQATVTGYKIHKTKMAPLADGKYRTFIVIEFPLSLAYKAYLTNLENSTSVSANMDKLKNTKAFKELEEYVNNFTGA